MALKLSKIHEANKILNNYTSFCKTSIIQYNNQEDEQLFKDEVEKILVGLGDNGTFTKCKPKYLKKRLVANFQKFDHIRDQAMMEEQEQSQE